MHHDSMNLNNRTNSMEGKAMVVRFAKHPVRLLPFGGILEFEKDIDTLFQDFLGGSRSRPFASGCPAMDMAEQGNETVVVMELPGVKKEDLKVVVEDGFLTVSGERKEHALPENSRWVRNEIAAGNFSRTIELPHAVKDQGISAELVNGLLTIVLPKADEVRPRQISVK
jgi:HSP20 family protein